MKSILYLFIFILTSSLIAQNSNLQNLKELDVVNMTDAQIESYWLNAQKKGYSLDDLEALAKLQGVSPVAVANLRARISNLSVSTASIDMPSLERSETPKIDAGIGISVGSDVNGSGANNEKSTIFGYDFFSNPNISFEPNLSLATPKNYQLGPKDELIISVWGAAENNYGVKINPDGSIRIPNIGPIFISGMPIDLASKKITSALKRIYGGISLSDSNPNKVYVDISLSNVRRVQIDIIGEVKAPATYSLSALSTVMNALYAAGGPNVNGTFRNVLHTRNGQVIGNLDIYEYLINGKLTGNNTLEDQDVIIVRPFKNRVEIKGQIKRPGKYEMKDNETFSNLLEYAGGFTSRAFKDVISVRRIEDGLLAIKDISLNEESLYIKDGDQINVSGIINKYINRVNIEGGVNKPGDYELENNMQLSTLIEKAFGVTDDAFLDRGVVYRLSEDGVTTILLPFSVKQIISGDASLELQNNDRVAILQKGSLSEDKLITITGAVNKPRKLRYMENMSIKDAIAIAGGFKLGANPDVVDVYRIIVDDDYTTESERVTRSLNTSFEISPEDDSFYLQPYDRVAVRFLKGYRGLKDVQIKGEVQYPGEYSIEYKNDRVSDLLERAGGLSPFAYTKGATLQRNSLKTNNEQQSEVIKNLASSDSLINNSSAPVRNSINLNLEKIVNNGKGSKYDLILEQGDILTIPSEKQTVQVKGEVLVPSVIRYDKAMSLKDYINSSGGFTTNAIKKKAYVVYPNGSVQGTKRFLFFRNYPKLEPGATILIPTRPERADRLTLQETIGITTGLGTLAIIIDRLSTR